MEDFTFVTDSVPVGTVEETKGNVVEIDVNTMPSCCTIDYIS